MPPVRCREDFFEHQKNHIERITNHLKRGWRDYIIAEAAFAALIRL